MFRFIFLISSSQVIFKLFTYACIFIYCGPMFFKSGYDGMKKGDRNCSFLAIPQTLQLIINWRHFVELRFGSFFMSVESLMIYFQVHSPELAQTFWTSDISLNGTFSYNLPSNIELLLSFFKYPYLSTVLRL